MSRSAKDLYRKDTRVSVPDLVLWTAALRDEWGLWVSVQWTPPLPSQANKNAGTVLVKAQRWNEGGLTEKVLAQRTVALGGRETVEEVGLQLLSAIYVGKQSSIWDEELAGLDPCAPQ